MGVIRSDRFSFAQIRMRPRVTYRGITVCERGDLRGRDLGVAKDFISVSGGKAWPLRIQESA